MTDLDIIGIWAWDCDLNICTSIDEVFGKHRHTLKLHRASKISFTSGFYWAPILDSVVFAICMCRSRLLSTFCFTDNILDATFWYPWTSIISNKSRNLIYTLRSFVVAFHKYPLLDKLNSVAFTVFLCIVNLCPLTFSCQNLS